MEGGDCIFLRIKSGKILAFAAALIFLSLTGNSTVLAQANDAIDTARIDTYIQHEMKAGNIPGLAVGIVRGSEVLYLKGFGTAGPGKGGVTPGTSFILGSVSKAFTGLAVLQLVEKGEVRLDDPVRKYIPWFSVGGPEASGKVKIVHLLNHTSGMPAFAGHDSGMERGGSLEERIRLKSSVRMKYPAGEKFEYSSLNYDVLGEVIQAVTGLSYEEYIQNNIFKPLEMTHSYTSLEQASMENLAVGYRPWFGFQIPAEIDYSMSALPSSYIISSAEDMTHFLAAFINQGKYGNNVISSEDTVMEAQNSIGNTAYGAGWFSSSYYKWHTGELANYNAYICTVPSKKLGIVMLSNTNDIGAKFLNPSSSSLRRIPEGIRVMLVGGSLPEGQLMNTKMTYLVIDLVIVLLFGLAVRLLIQPYKLRLDKKINRFSFGIRTVVTPVIPAVLVVGIPVWIQGSWPALLISVPDLSLSVLVFSILMMTSCVAGAISSMYRVKANKKINKREM